MLINNFLRVSDNLVLLWFNYMYNLDTIFSIALMYGVRMIMNMIKTKKMPHCTHTKNQGQKFGSGKKEIAFLH